MDFYEEDDDIIRSSRSQMFSKIGALKKFAMFTGKRLCWSLFLIKLLDFRPATLFKRDSQTGVFQVFTFFYIIPLVAAFLLDYCFSQRKLSCAPVIFNLTFSLGRNITLTFWLTYFSIYNFHSYFLTITRLKFYSFVMNKKKAL